MIYPDVQKIYCTRQEHCFLNKVHRDQNNASPASVASSIWQMLWIIVMNEGIGLLDKGALFQFLMLMSMKKLISHTKIISHSQNTQKKELSK